MKGQLNLKSSGLDEKAETIDELRGELNRMESVLDEQRVQFESQREELKNEVRRIAREKRGHSSSLR